VPPEDWRDPRIAWMAEAEECPVCQIRSQEQDGVEDRRRAWTHVKLLPLSADEAEERARYEQERAAAAQRLEAARNAALHPAHGGSPA
jgi:hypothetical protein